MIDPRDTRRVLALRARDLRRGGTRARCGRCSSASPGPEPRTPRPEETTCRFTHEHQEIQRTLKRFIDEEINPHVDEWEAAEEFPGARGVQAARRAGPAGPDQARGIRRHGPRLFVLDGDGRDAGPHRLRRRADGDRRADRHGTPALARFGSDELRREFLAPAIAGDVVGCIGVSEPGAGSRRGRHQDDGAQGRRRLRHQRRQDVDHQQPAGRLDVPAGQHLAKARRTRTRR